MKEKNLAKYPLNPSSSLITFPPHFSKLFGLLIILFLLLITSVVLIFLINSSLEKLKKEYNDYVTLTSSNIDSLNKKIIELNNEKSDLNKSFIKLSLDYSSLFVKANELESSYFNLKEEVDNTLIKIEDYEKQIQSSLEWFNNNSFLNTTDSKIISKLKSNCRKITSNGCQINLGCFNLVNSEFINYKYKDDLVTSNTVDKLQSIEEFIKNKGGDCEDFSLFFKSEYNSLTEYCSDKPLVLFAWVSEKNSRFYANFNETWYLSNAQKKYLNKENIYPVVVCGAIFDPNVQVINGHCVVAFANKKIISFEDISALNSAELIEPQSGAYLGFVGDDSGVYLISQNSSSQSYINTLITNNDFFIYKNEEWVSYSKFGEELDDQKEKLFELVE